MFNLSSPFAPFLLFASFVALSNIAQAFYLTYKLFNGYGMTFPDVSHTFGKRHVATFSELLVAPDKAGRTQKFVLFVTGFLFFASVFIMIRIIRSLPLS
jgi:hypothetical protein